mmetsp:Transcript_25579/g.36025  ORF Transcript_25579/g.36025 Transcript_25579/m.36025 type:complete len:351 (+) Transcript_25579:333-1385(+)
MSDVFEKNDVNETTTTVATTAIPSSPAVKTIDDFVAATPSAEGGVLNNNDTTILEEDDIDEKNSLTPTRTTTFGDCDQEQQQTPGLLNGQNQQQQQPGTPDNSSTDKDSFLGVIFGSCTGGVVTAQDIFSQCRGKVREGFKSTKIDTRNVGVYQSNTNRQQRKAAAAAAAAANVPFVVQKKDTSGSDINGSNGGGDGMASDAGDCDDTISAISALTLDEMAKFHHQSTLMMKDMRANSELRSPKATTTPSQKSTTSYGGDGIGDNEETVTERLARYNFPFAISKARSNDSSKQQSLAETSGSSSAGGNDVVHKKKASLKNIQQHDKLMSELSNELQISREDETPMVASEH